MLSGEELKKLMVGGALPEEYISEENLRALLNYEYDQMGNKNKYYDQSVVHYCTALFEEKYTDEDYKKRKQETFEKIKARIAAYEKRKKRLLRRITQITAACIICLISAQIISFTAFGTDLFGWTKDKFLELLGVETEQGDMSVQVSRTKNYEKIEELEQAENIDIMIPMWLPGDMKIEFIFYSYEYEQKQIDIIYDDGIVSLIIELNSNIPNTDGSEIYIANGVDFYIFKEANVIYWEYDGNFYNLSFGFDVSGYAEKIIENIK